MSMGGRTAHVTRRRACPVTWGVPSEVTAGEVVQGLGRGQLGTTAVAEAPADLGHAVQQAVGARRPLLDEPRGAAVAARTASRKSSASR